MITKNIIQCPNCGGEITLKQLREEFDLVFFDEEDLGYYISCKICGEEDVEVTFLESSNKNGEENKDRTTIPTIFYAKTTRY